MTFARARTVPRLFSRVAGRSQLGSATFLQHHTQRSSFTSVLRSLATAAGGKKPDMFCFQCEQTEHQSGCTKIGVCGKTPEVATLQDLLIHCVKGVAQYATAARDLGAQYKESEIDDFIKETLFATMTNVNFDPERFVTYLRQAEHFRSRAQALYDRASREQNKSSALTGPAGFNLDPSFSKDALIKQGKVQGVLDRKSQYGDDYIGLQEMIMYGLKGTCAYLHHANTLGRVDPTIDADIVRAVSELTDYSKSVNDLLALALRVGEINLRVMSLLDAGHNQKFGHPTPTSVTIGPQKAGKAILVSGHDMIDLEAILKQSAGKGISVYTHGEMLNAHAYPGLKQFPHLTGHFGGPWQLQKFEFGQFPGSILMTSNCLIEPQRKYKDRLFTTQVVGWPGVKHVSREDFSSVIQSSLKQDGFQDDEIEPEKNKNVTTGFSHHTVLSIADKVIAAVEQGKIGRFFVVGGCDGSEGERSYFTDIAKNAPKNSVFLTMGCGKYRILKLPLGDIDGIPRVLDMGQCNDSYSGIQIALALAKHFKTDVNSLPLSFAVSWFEQKAVAVLLTLLHLNIQHIRLGPHLPGFATPNMLKILQDKFQIKPIGNVQEDLAQMALGK